MKLLIVTRSLPCWVPRGGGGGEVVPRAACARREAPTLQLLSALLRAVGALRASGAGLAARARANQRVLGPLWGSGQGHFLGLWSMWGLARGKLAQLQVHQPGGTYLSCDWRNALEMACGHIVPV